MLGFKKKVLIVGIACLIPSYVMGRCSGTINNQGARGECQGQPFHLSTTSIHYENQRLTNEVFDEVLNISDNINELHKNLGIARESLRIAKISLRGIKGIKSELNQVNRQMRQMGNNSRERTRLERIASSLLEKLNIAQENSAIELSRVHSQYAIEIASLRNRIAQTDSQNSQLKQNLRYKERQNNNLKKLIQDSANIVSYSISSKFQDYQTCIEHNNVLANLLLTPISRKNKDRGSFLGMSSGNSNFGSNYSRIFSALSGMSVSRQSLEACAVDFQSLHDRFTLYEVGLSLFLNPNNQSVVYYLFKNYGLPNPNYQEVQRFMNAFQAFPKSDLVNLINNIQEYMDSYKRRR